MFAAALGLIVIGVLFFVISPWVGILAGIAGLALLALFLAGIGRAAVESRP
jgi:hypothetical protein